MTTKMAAVFQRMEFSAGQFRKKTETHQNTSKYTLEEPRM